MYILHASGTSTSKIIFFVRNLALQAETGNTIDRTLNFPANEAEISVSFIVRNDDIALEPTESLVWTLSLEGDNDRATVSPYNTTTIQIIDDDGTC